MLIIILAKDFVNQISNIIINVCTKSLNWFMFTKEEISRVNAFVRDSKGLIIIYCGRSVSLKDSCLIYSELFVNRRQYLLDVVDPFDFLLLDAFLLW